MFAAAMYLIIDLILTAQKINPIKKVSAATIYKTDKTMWPNFYSM